ncbi:MAG: class I SAM-dependent methyltransferase [Candidatus Berkiellales bacterium]
MSLPPPSADALEHQQQLLKYLRTTCEQAGGWISFADFMDIALYAPGLGYYSAGMNKFGISGDFVTAPEISPLFSQCMGAQCAQVLSHLNANEMNILELGAGSGKMASIILPYLAEQNCLPKHYWILEVSADLKARQQQYLNEHCQPFFDKFVWLERLPEKPFEGIIIGNEVLDAMPVHLFQIGNNHQILEGFVGEANGTWQLAYREPKTPHLKEAVENLHVDFSPGYTSEINLSLNPLVEALSQSLEKGIILFLDYGFPRHEYYHPSRHMGTLTCHYRHHVISDPLQYIGLQDITAHVDFTAVALAGQSCGLDLVGFTHQAAFLIGNDLLKFAEAAAHQTSYAISQQIQYLTAPHEMGELFKAIALSKRFEELVRKEPLKGFQMFDQRQRL